MKTYAKTAPSKFRQLFKLTDEQILEKGKCIFKETEVGKTHRDNYVFYIKNKWVNLYNDRREPPKDHQLFNVKFRS